MKKIFERYMTGILLIIAVLAYAAVVLFQDVIPCLPGRSLCTSSVPVNFSGKLSLALLIGSFSVGVLSEIFKPIWKRTAQKIAYAVFIAAVLFMLVNYVLLGLNKLSYWRKGEFLITAV